MKKVSLDGFMKNSTHVFLVRHGESKFNDLNRIQGHRDSKLTKKGSLQIKKLARRLVGLGVSKIYSSDLGRAFMSTELIQEKLKVRVIKDRRLREINLGAWEGLSPEEVNVRFNGGYSRWRKSPSRTRIPGAERVHQFHKRVRTRVEKIITNERGKRILILTHGGVIASLISHWLKADFDRVLLSIKIDNSSLTVLERTPMRTKLHAINDVTHLNGTDLNERNVFTGSA